MWRRGVGIGDQWQRGGVSVGIGINGSLGARRGSFKNAIGASLMALAAAAAAARLGASAAAA